MMHLATFSADRNRSLARFVKYRIKERFKALKYGLTNKPKDGLTKEGLEALRTKGFFVIPNYISEVQAIMLGDRLIKGFERHAAFVQYGDDKRLFGLERIWPEYGEIMRSKNLSLLATRICCEESRSFFTMGNLLEAGSNGSSGDGWHRDSCFRQFKAMLYLSDVSASNGPFEIIPYSQRTHNYLLADLRLGIRTDQNRMTNEDVSRYCDISCKKAVQLTGAPGTLILFDSSTIHRGAPIKDGIRLALTDYYYPASIDADKLIEKFSPVLR